MAITDLGHLAGGGSATADQASLTVTTLAAVAAGELLVVYTVVDVAGLSSGIDASTFDLRIGGTNGDRFLDRRSNQPGTGSQTGVACSLWWMIAPQAYPSGTQIVAKFNSPTESDHSVLMARHYSLAAGNTIADVGNGWASSVFTATSQPPVMDVTATGSSLRVRTIGAKWNLGDAIGYAQTVGWANWPTTVTAPAGPSWILSVWGEHLVTAAVNAASGPINPGTTPTLAQKQTSLYVVFAEVPLPPITGVLAATEGSSDSGNFSGGLSLQGTLEAYEGAVWLTADSTLYTADDNVTRVNTAGQIRDIANFSGQVLTGPIGVIAATEGADTAVFAGLVGRTGVLTATENADTATFAGTVAWPVITGTLVATEASDTALFAGFAQASGTLAATEAQDTAAFVGGPVVAGTLAATEDADTADFHAVLTNAGTLDAVEVESDTAAFAGSVYVAVTLAATEASDVPAFTGYLSLVDEKVGTLDAFEDRVGGYSEPRADSTLVTADNTLFHASIDYFGQDRALFNGEIVTNAQIVATEAADVAAFAGEVVVAGVLAATEARDTAAFAGSVSFAITGVLAAREGRDTAHFSEPELEIKGVLAAVEASDTAHFAVPSWEQVEEGAGLKNELQRTIWLAGRGGRVTWLENEVEDTSWLQDLNPEVISLENEVLRITELRP